MNSTPESAPVADHAQPPGYPWGVCLGRFFKRLMCGVLAWIVVVILIVASAIPYGNSGRELPFLLFLVTIAALLWALSGFIPPGKYKFEIEDNSV